MSAPISFRLTLQAQTFVTEGDGTFARQHLLPAGTYVMVVDKDQYTLADRILDLQNELTWARADTELLSFLESRAKQEGMLQPLDNLREHIRNAMRETHLRDGTNGIVI